MRPDEHLLLAGASVRAAAFSALRAGLRPWCMDLFADADLRARCPAVALPPGRYLRGLVEAFAGAPPGPWLYTGALENRPRLVAALSRRRPLWGNGPAVLRRVRSPYLLAACLRAAGLPHPALRRVTSRLPPEGRWLLKPRDGAGGRGIAFGITSLVRRGRWYLQEYVEGEPCAAVYVADGERVQFLGVTHQLVGEPWLHAAPFHYCGSIGPLPLTAPLHGAFQLLGRALVEGFGLRGLFGVDCVVRGGVPYPVEVNPRYTASMELVEHHLQAPLLARHRQAFDPAAPADAAARPAAGVLGKAVLFARQALTFPADGPWAPCLRRPADPWELPAFADIPGPGTRVEAGRPVLTFFARADSVAACREALRQTAVALDKDCFR
jgi:predicted ATP-grasp superfamily ATP-dependent carboligase